MELVITENASQELKEAEEYHRRISAWFHEEIAVPLLEEMQRDTDRLYGVTEGPEKDD